jgi:UDP-N-acetylglucosamine acyltransferase
MKAHPSALLDSGAKIADDVEIGPFCSIGAGVTVGAGCRLGAHVMLQGPDVVIGRNNVFHAHSKVGAPNCGRIRIGDGNVFRENSHVDGPKPGYETHVGSRSRFGVCVAIGSGCTIGNDVLMGAYALLAECCVVEDEARLEAAVVIGNEEPRRVGRSSRVRSMVPLGEDVPPSMIMDWNLSELVPYARDIRSVLEGGGP